jgi:heme oxygenase
MITSSPNRSLRQSLKRGTVTFHRRLEAKLNLLGPDLDPQRYRRVLELLYGFYSPVEHALTRFVAIVPFPLRARAVQLEDDLLTLGLSPLQLAALPLCEDIPTLSCSAEVAGCLYVLEGACLGGQIVARVLRKRLGVAKGTGASFFAGDEERTAVRWALVLEWLERLERSGASPDPIVAQAKATFDALERWVDRPQPSWSPGGSHD